MKDELVPRELLDGVVRRLDPVEVWLFGSRARGDHRPDSDYDLYVIVDDARVSVRSEPGALAEASRDFRGSVDLLVTEASRFEKRRRVFGTLDETVEHDGVRVYVRDEGVRPVIEWLKRAMEDVQVGRLSIDNELLTPAALHAQQALEKVLKARLIRAGVRAPRSHELADLNAALPEAFRLTGLNLEVISTWSILGRYGFEVEPDAAALAAVLARPSGRSRRRATTKARPRPAASTTGSTPRCRRSSARTGCRGRRAG